MQYEATVPAAVDRMICQAIAQVLTPIFDPQFHPHSFGFRPGRSQHQAVERARQFIADGAVWCVDFDLESFFDRVQHDALMARVARRVHDKRLLKLIRRYLEAGVMEGGLVHASEEGTPQGSPLSPLLSNVMLDDLDWELERRGHRFVRYADDGRIYVQQRAGGRAGHGEHHAVRRATPQAQGQPREIGGRPRDETAPSWVPVLRPRRRGQGADRSRSARKRAKDRLRQLTSRRWGVSMERRIDEINRFTVGWTAYYALADTPSAVRGASTSGSARRLRQVRWKEWKRPQTKRRNLDRAGNPRSATRRQWAYSRKGYWRDRRLPDPLPRPA